MWLLQEGDAISTRIKYSDSERLGRELAQFLANGGKCVDLDEKKRTSEKAVKKKRVVIDKAERRLHRMIYQKNILGRYFNAYDLNRGVKGKGALDLLVKESGTKMNKVYICQARKGKFHIKDDVEWQKIETAVFKLIGVKNG